jgi:ATP-dependent DNA ligase
MQCKPASSLPTGEKWVFEIKFDGYRCIVVKRLGSIYEPGERSGAWIKLRTNLEQEFVIGGYIPGARGFDALLLGVYENKRLKFVAKVKNGFVPRIRDELFPALKALQTAKCPFGNLPEKRASRWGESLTAEKMHQCRWVKPKLVCQVAFVEWTDARHLRHCTFIAMRDDKKPAEVVRET